MKTKRIIIFLLLFVTLQECCQKDNENFASKMSSVLNVQLVYTFKNNLTSISRIYGDTLASFDSLYFVQDLKTGNRRYINVITSTSDNIELYKNSNLYISRDRSLLKINFDGRKESLLEGYEKQIFFNNKSLFYKNKQIIITMNGIFIFENKKLIYKFSTKDGVDYGLSLIIGNTLVFTESPEPNIRNRKVIVRSLNLESMVESWSTSIPNTVTCIYDNRYNAVHTLITDGILLYLPTIKGLLCLNLLDGSIKWSMKWIGIGYQCSEIELKKQKLYFSDNQYLFCLGKYDGKVSWKKPKLLYVGECNGKVIATDFSKKVFFILNHRNGNLIQKFVFEKNNEITMMGKYFLLNGHLLYK